MAWFSDGLFVVAATQEFRSLLGAQVLQIGDRPAAAALEAIQPVISRDNDTAFRLVAPDFATIPEILSAMKITQTPSGVPFKLRTASGEEVTQDFRPLLLNASASWIDVFEARQVARPLYLRQPEKHYWVEYLEGQRTVYARISAILDSPELSTALFSRDLFAFIGSHAVDRLVLDFRGSPGGNNQLFRGLLLGLIRETTINQPGKLFVLIDRGTFSAAVGAAADLRTSQIRSSLVSPPLEPPVPGEIQSGSRCRIAAWSRGSRRFIGETQLPTRPARLSHQIFPLHFRRRTTLQAAIRRWKRLTGSRNNPASLTFWRTC